MKLGLYYSSYEPRLQSIIDTGGNMANEMNYANIKLSLQERNLLDIYRQHRGKNIVVSLKLLDSSTPTPYILLDNDNNMEKFMGKDNRTEKEKALDCVRLFIAAETGIPLSKLTSEYIKRDYQARKIKTNKENERRNINLNDSPSVT